MATQLFTREGKAHTGRVFKNAKDQPGFLVLRKCGRCGGVGGSDKWKHTGWTCYECGGKGDKGIHDFIRLYDADKLASLNATQAKRDATRARKAAEAAAVEAARIERERGEVMAAHKDILARMAPWTGSSAFLADMSAQVAERAKPLTERQLEAATNACAKMEAEAARRAAAAWIGTVGERVTLNLTYLRHIDLTEPYFGAPTFIIWVFRNEDGSSVVFKGGYPKAFYGLEMETVEGERRIKKGAAIRLKATVKKHDRNRKTGEPETILQRPAVVK